MHKIENKCLWRDKMRYGVGIWYLDSTFGELKIMLAFG